MRAVIPAAGIGTRLRPHTLNKPKALLPVAGKPIIGHIVDDLQAAGITGFVVVVGYMGDAVRNWFARACPELPVTFVEQSERLGLGHAVWMAREALGEEPFFCILGDTILKADYRHLVQARQSVVAVREVADPRRFGVVDLVDGQVARFVEKPEVPPSNLALVGAYLFREAPVLWEALGRLLADNIRTKGEYQLTDAMQMMVAGGIPFGTVAVDDWFDCGKPETWLETNRALLDQITAPAPPGVTPPCAIAPDAMLDRSEIGPHVTIGSRTSLTNCRLRDCVIGDFSRLENCRLTGSLVGEHCQISGIDGTVNVGDFAELRLKEG